LQAATLDWLTDRILDALARGERVGPAALLYLLRRLSAEGRDDIAEPLGAAFAHELDLQSRQADTGEDDESPAWLAVFSEAATVSDDPRLLQAATDLLARVRPVWGPPSASAKASADRRSLGEGWSGRLTPDPTIAVDEVMRAVEACLVSVNIPEARSLAAEAIDALERVVAGTYRPGEGMSYRAAASPFGRGGLADQVRSASALLTAYMLTARLPYAMLADELMQRVVHTPSGERDVPFALGCETARVFCRLAALHHDEEYRQKAVLAADTDYVQEAERTLDALAPSVPERGVEAAPFGLALAEWLNLQ
jgi:hypothetical protein